MTHHLYARRWRRAAMAASVVAMLGLSSCLVPDPTPADIVPAVGDMPAGVDRTFPSPSQVPLQLTVYEPTAPATADRPVMLFLHGGGFFSGGRDIQHAGTGYTQTAGRVIRAQLARGWVVVSADYGLSVDETSGSHHVTLQDQLANAKAAVRYLQDPTNAAGFDIDPNKVVVAGSSAGGTLASLIALTPGEFEPVPGTETIVRGSMNIDGPIDLRKFQACAEDPAHGPCAPRGGQVQPALPATSPAATARFGADVSYDEFLPAALGCANGTLQSAPCRATVQAQLTTISPYDIVLGDTVADAARYAPMYIACSEPGTVNMPGENSCAPDKRPFYDLVIARSGSWAVVLDENPGNHLDMENHINFTQFNAFLDAAVK